MTTVDKLLPFYPHIPLLYCYTLLGGMGVKVSFLIVNRQLSFIMSNNCKGYCNTVIMDTVSHYNRQVF